MKRILRNFSLVLLIFFIALSTLIGSTSNLNIFKKNDDILILDANSNTPLPNKYRDIPTLNISGSAQFTKLQIESLKNVINKKNICIVDLRQESHGLINDIAISYHNLYKTLNNGLTSIETIEKEISDFDRIKLNSKIKFYQKSGKLLDCAIVSYIDIEEKLVKSSALEYKRFAVQDTHTPSPSTIDEFINFVKNKPENLHLHFHCDAGEGRTTTFMVLYQIMINPNNLTLDQILAYQYNIGGTLLTNSKDRLTFLLGFYDYVKETKESNYTLSYFQWLQSQSNCETEKTA